jgi:hypothetical protein
VIPHFLGSTSDAAFASQTPSAPQLSSTASVACKRSRTSAVRYTLLVDTIVVLVMNLLVLAVVSEVRSQKRESGTDPRGLFAPFLLIVELSSFSLITDVVRGLHHGTWPLQSEKLLLLARSRQTPVTSIQAPSAEKRQ